MISGFLLVKSLPLCFEEWWDQCEEAGQKRRVAEAFGTPRPNLEILNFADKTLSFLGVFFEGSTLSPIFILQITFC